MARQTRAERRARRQAQAQSQPQPVEPVREAPVESAAPSPERQDQGRSGIWGVRFIKESIAELMKVEWPSQNHVIQGTIVVFVACIILGTFIWLCDIAFKHLVQDVLLR